MIVSELVSNSLKHAFDEGDDGEITIILKSEDNEFILIVGDNGKGFPLNINFKESDSLGLQLVNTLVDQIDGTIEMNTEHGTEFRIIFKEIDRT